METITLQEIKAQQISPKQLYKTTETCHTIGSAIRSELKLNNLTDEYVSTFVKCAVDEIIAANKRSNTMSEEEISDLANRIARRKRNVWSIYDVRMFADLLIDGELLEQDSKGNWSGRLYSVDVAGVMAKVKVYDTQRNDAQYTLMQSNTAETEYKEKRKYEHSVPMPDDLAERIICKALTAEERQARDEWGRENLRLYSMGVGGDDVAMAEYYRRIRNGYEPIF